MLVDIASPVAKKNFNEHGRTLSSKDRRRTRNGSGIPTGSGNPVSAIGNYEKVTRQGDRGGKRWWEQRVQAREKKNEVARVTRHRPTRNKADKH